MRRRIREAEAPRIDASIEDTEAWELRKELAQQSAVRKQEEAQKLQEENEVMQTRLSTVGKATDIDIMETSAGQLRLKRAEESRVRKAKEAHKLAAQNEVYFKKIKAHFPQDTESGEPRALQRRCAQP